MNSIKLIAVILIFVVGLNLAFPEKSAEFRARIFEGIVGVLGRIPVISDRIPGIASDLSKRLDNLPKTAEVVREKIEEAQRVIFSDPLRASKDTQVRAADVVLTDSGIVSFTNRFRISNNLPALSVNADLNYTAKLKLQDMFAKQYFGHISPEGFGPAEVAKKASYEYILIGENLALGNFKGDEELVTAWMNSPGHRANILNTRFTEIGVAVQKEFYEGREVWMAVQEFGLPLSSCPGPSEDLRNQIDGNQDRLQDLLVELTRRKEEIDNTPRNSPEYNQKVEDYNERVAAYNELLEATRSMIETYNSEVKQFNECLSG